MRQAEPASSLPTSTPYKESTGPLLGCPPASPYSRYLKPPTSTLTRKQLAGPRHRRLPEAFTNPTGHVGFWSVNATPPRTAVQPDASK